MSLRSGFNMPPGCFKTPAEEPCICDVCLGDAEREDNNPQGCLCPMCPICEEAGNPDCEKKHGLILSEDIKIKIQERKDYWEKQNKIEYEADEVNMILDEYWDDMAKDLQNNS